MEGLLDTTHGTSTLLASLVIIMALHLFFKIGEAVWNYLKKKSELSEQSVTGLTAAVLKLESRLEKIEKELSVIPKLRLDLRRIFIAVKQLAGDNWEEIKKLIMEEDDLAQ